ncbi:hypothetical protein [Pseudomonas syringae]|uniref:Uncharacterized protein n=2 Tax=Pseudomonas syringae TaxID=317 RepID=A0A0N8SY65_PSESX|nr:hypothetical protein [Pseudomonas syringae]KPY70728.1 Unknown protein sequence [Pseudomonas syringae pv. spinaceae]KTB78505.1 hypothetical protein AO069_03545 [Pseudomonas syringae pv. syringae PD2774]KWS25893.1 hypothetical protein AL061_16960 [Pseudomonas syringae pv. syringae]MDY2564757.1 hypothetical protein [Pseudomonas syringae]RMT29094.1 hypothetical protein ALP50_200080 [Pseudomonas syringae pv. spinaceae]
MMKNISLIRRAFDVDQHLVLRTPQVEAAIQQMMAALQTEADPVIYLSGLSGSGVSTVLAETSQRLGHANGTACFTLARPEINDQYLPSEYLLHHFGFRFATRHYHKVLPREVFALGGILAHSIMLIEDYLAGVASLEQKRKHMHQWSQLTAPPISLRIVLAGPSDHIKGSWASHRPNGRTICIEEWRFNDLFRNYLKDISSLVYRTYELDVDLPLYAKSLFKLSRGNTARLLEYLRECVRRTILSAETGVCAKLFKLSYREIVYANAKSLRDLTDS